MNKTQELQTRIAALSAERQRLDRQSFDRRNYDSLTSQIWRLRKELTKERRANVGR